MAETYRFQNYSGSEMAALFDKIAALGPATSAVSGTMSAADKAKLDGMNSGAQANVIEGVSIGGVAQSIANKIVTIPLDNNPTSNSNNLVKSGGVYYALSQKYAKPAGGIPKTDLVSAVQTSLDKADAALPKSSVSVSNDTLIINNV